MNSAVVAEDVLEASILSKALGGDNRSLVQVQPSDVLDAHTDEQTLVSLFRSLLEAGNYDHGVSLAEGLLDVRDLAPELAVAARTFAAFFRLFVSGEVADASAELQQLLEKPITSLQRARVLDLLARVAALSVSFKLLSDSALIRARQMMGEAVEIFAASGAHEERGRAVLGLAQIHAVASIPDPVSALYIVRGAIASLPEGLDVSFDLVRRELELRLTCDSNPAPMHEVLAAYQQVRQAAMADADPLQLGLVELSMARSIKMQGGNPADHLEAAGRIFEERGYLSGLFEVRSTLATLAFERGHHTRALKQFRRLLELSDQMGFSQGTAVAQLGVFQSLVAMGEIEQAKVMVPVLLKLCKTPAVLGSLGLSISAALQLVGESERSLQLVERTEKLFRQQQVKEMLSHALFVRGSCQAALGLWEGAKRSWTAAMKVDRELGHLGAELEKMVARSQAEIMIELTAHSSVSPAAAARIKKQLRSGAEKATSLGTPGVRLRGKIFQAEAQLELVTKDPLGAVRSFSQAREEYHRIGLVRDVAFVDALIGIALLDISRSTHPNMIDEAIDSFRRALDYFNAEPVPAIRWKLHYYLGFCCLVAGNAKGSDAELVKWREAARSWVRAANSDLEQVSEGNGGRSNGDTDFAPGLSPKLLEELTSELSSNSDTVKKSAKSRRENRHGRSIKHLH